MNTIIIDEQTNLELQNMTYEVVGLQDLLSHMAKNGVDPESDTYKQIYNKYIKLNAEYNITKTNMATAYNIPVGTNWNLDFKSKTVSY